MDERTQCQAYLKSTVNPLFQDMVSELLDIKPSNPIPFLVSWLQERTGAALTSSEREELLRLRQEIRQLSGDPARTSGGEESGEEEFEEETKKVTKHHRKEVSSEAFGEYNKQEAVVIRNIAKTPAQRKRIEERLGKVFMFTGLDAKETETIVSAMEERKYAAGDQVIKQGDEGDALYVVDAGKLDCFKTYPTSESPIFIKTYLPGECFGELSLLYSLPRAASITAKTAATLLALDRLTFGHVVKEAAVKRRERYDGLLKKVELLGTMEPYQRQLLADVFKTVMFNDGEFVLREGDWGEVFYIIESGHARATKMLSPGSEPALILEYKPGDYFGELALLNGEPRAANILAVGELKCVTLDRGAFVRLLGPLEGLLRKNEGKYAEVLAKVRQTV